jgi:transposase
MRDCITPTRVIHPRDFDVFVGMDTDKRSAAVTHLDHLGIERSLKMPSDGSVLVNWAGNHFAGKRLAFVYEAGPTGFGLYDSLTEAGYVCLVVSPSSVPTARGKRVKTNRLDSRKLAYQLRGGALEGIRVPSDEYRQLRELVTLRKMHMNSAAAAKQRIKALFLRNGMKFPWQTPGGYWSIAVVNGLRMYECNNKVVRFKLNSLLDSLDFSKYQASYAQATIRELTESVPEFSESMRYAMSVPGVGWIVASYAVARIGDWRLLEKSNNTAGFFGLVPTENSTGEGADRGSITKSGDPVMRSLMIEAAWTAVRKDPEMAEFYKRVYASHSRDKAARIAIVAVARKMVGRLHCVLRERRMYEPRTDIITQKKQV